MIKEYNKKVILFFILIVFLATLIAFIYFLGPKGIVDKIGIKNSYIVAFAVSFFGGFSAFGSVSFIATLITLSLGGINPLYLGVVAGIALSIGDFILFYIGSKGRELVKGKWEQRIIRFSKRIEKNKIKKIMPFLAYFYIGLTPFPNDFMILFLALIKYPKKKVYLPIILGDLTFALLVSFLGAKGMILF